MKKCSIFVIAFTFSVLMLFAIGGKEVVPFEALQKIRTSLSGVGTAINGFIEKNNLTEENDLLKKELTDLKQKEAESEKLKYENEMLKEALSVENPLKNHYRVNATVTGINREGGFFLIIDRGAKHGIQKNNAVVFGSALVGKVASVMPDSATVIPFTSPDCTVGVVTTKGDRGILRADGRLLPQNMCRVEFFGNTKIEKGETFITSGLSDTYPADLLVGEAVVKNNEVFLKAQVDFFKIQTLSVIPSEVRREQSRK